MKILIRNFGPIKSFDFRLADNFTLIVGDNNIGKSYAISVVYLVLKALAFPRRQGGHAEYFVDSLPYDLVPRGWFDEFEKEFGQAGVVDDERNVTEQMREHVTQLFDRVFIPRLTRSIYGTFNEISNLQNRLTRDPMTLTIEVDELSITIGADGEKLVVNKVDFHGHEYFVRKVKAIRTVKDIGKRSVIYFPTESKRHFEINYARVLRSTFGSLIRAVASSVSDIHYLPASRSGLYQALSAFGQIVAELARNRTLLTGKLELPGISEPLSDYFLKLSDIRPVARVMSESMYVAIAQKIEREILRGTVDFDPKTKRLTFLPEKVDLKLDLSATLSMVSEISPIASYLKYVLSRSDQFAQRRQKGNEEARQVIIIEEPEAHLHPEVQVQLVAVFAELVRSTPTKIIMTSHSNYIFNKASNLIMERAIDTTSFRALLFKRGSEGSTAQELTVTELGIDDENFVDVAEALYEEKLRLIEHAGSIKGVRRNTKPS